MLDVGWLNGWMSLLERVEKTIEIWDKKALKRAMSMRPRLRHNNMPMPLE